jgi:hypothetical protein
MSVFGFIFISCYPFLLSAAKDGDAATPVFLLVHVAAAADTTRPMFASSAPSATAQAILYGNYAPKKSIDRVEQGPARSDRE